MVTVHLNTDDVELANMLTRAILSEIDTWAIDIVSFDVNTSSRVDEVLAHRMCLLIVDNETYNPDEMGVRFHVDVEALGRIREFTTNDIPGIPFAEETPIAMLLPGQRIVCDIILRERSARTHVKWRPVSTVCFEEAKGGGYMLRMKTLGMLSAETILARGIDKIRVAAERPAETKFTKVSFANLATFDMTQL